QYASNDLQREHRRVPSLVGRVPDRRKRPIFLQREQRLLVRGYADAPDALAVDFRAIQRERHLEPLTLTLDLQGCRLIRLLHDETLQLSEMLYRLAIETDDSIAGLEAGARPGAAVGDARHDGGYVRRADLEAEAREQFLGLGEITSAIARDEAQRPLGTVRATHAHIDRTVIDEIFEDTEGRRFQRFDVRAAHRNDLIALLQACLGGDRVRRDFADERLQGGDARDEQYPIHEHCEHQVESGSGEQYGDALPHRLAIERTRCLAGGNVAFALVQQLHVAAEGQRRNPVFDPVLATRSTPNRLTETDREAQHAHAEPPCHPEMPEFVYRDQNADRDDEGENRDQILKRRVRRNHAQAPASATAARASRRAHSSALSTSSSVTMGAVRCCSRTLSITAGMSTNAKRRSRKASTAISFAAFSTAGAVPPASAALLASRRHGKRVVSGASKSNRAVRMMSNDSTPEVNRSGQ